MTTPMSMFRSGIFLMASFIGVAGLFILLSADLIGLLQVMMYIGGMLVMILFMVLFMQDPGGAMMAGMMKMSAIETFFSLGLKPQGDSDDHDHMDMGDMQHGDNAPMQDDGDDQNQNDHGHMDMSDHAPMQHDGHDHMKNGSAQKHNDHSDMDMGGMNMDDMQHGDDDGMGDMSMTTPIKRPAVVLAVLVGTLLVMLLLVRPAWPLATATPDPRSAEQVGTLLMGKYMIAFEGAGLLILVGIFGAVFLARPGAFPDNSTRAAQVAVDERPVPAEAVPLPALLTTAAPDDERSEDVVAAHQDEGAR